MSFQLRIGLEQGRSLMLLLIYLSDMLGLTSWKALVQRELHDTDPEVCLR